MKMKLTGREKFVKLNNSNNKNQEKEWKQNMWLLFEFNQQSNIIR